MPRSLTVLARPARLALAAFALLALAACSSHPLGMSKEEWNRLTPEQQLQARTKQAEINRAAAERRAVRREAQRQRQASAEAEERRRLAQMYASGRFGDVLECVVDRGRADFHPGWHAYSPVPFTLARGEGTYVTVRGQGRRNGKFWAEFSLNGLEVTLCYRKPHRSRRTKCVSMAGMTRDFAYGISHPISIDNGFQNARLLCAFRPGQGMNNTFYRQHNVNVWRQIHTHHYPGRRYQNPQYRYRHRDREYAPRRGPAPARGRAHGQQPQPRAVPAPPSRHRRDEPVDVRRRPNRTPGRAPVMRAPPVSTEPLPAPRGSHSTAPVRRVAPVATAPAVAPPMTRPQPPARTVGRNANRRLPPAASQSPSPRTGVVSRQQPAPSGRGNARPAKKSAAVQTAPAKSSPPKSPAKSKGGSVAKGKGKSKDSTASKGKSKGKSKDSTASKGKSKGKGKAHAQAGQSGGKAENGKARRNR